MTTAPRKKRPKSQSKISRLAFSHTQLTKDELDDLERLPSPLCAAKACYSACEYVDAERECVPLCQQELVAGNLLGLLSFDRALERIGVAAAYSQERRSQNELLFAIAYINLLKEFTQEVLANNMRWVLNGADDNVSALVDKVVREVEAERDGTWEASRRVEYTPAEKAKMVVDNRRAMAAEKRKLLREEQDKEYERMLYSRKSLSRESAQRLSEYLLKKAELSAIRSEAGRKGGSKQKVKFGGDDTKNVTLTQEEKDEIKF